jgi:hypothetical protein
MGPAVKAILYTVEVDMVLSIGLLRHGYGIQGSIGGPKALK